MYNLVLNTAAVFIALLALIGLIEIMALIIWSGQGCEKKGSEKNETKNLHNN